MMNPLPSSFETINKPVLGCDLEILRKPKTEHKACITKELEAEVVIPFGLL